MYQVLRPLVAALTALLLPVVSGCGGKGGQDAAGRPAKIAFVSAAIGLNFADEMGDGFRTSAEQVGGVEYKVDGPPIVDGPRQLAIFKEAAAAYPGGVSIFTMTPELLARPLAEAAKNGIPLIAVDNRLPAAAGVKLFVGNDNYELGRLLADEVVKRLPADAKGDIVLGVTSPGVPVLENRALGMRDRLRERLPGVDLLGPFDTKQEVAANLEAWRGLVRANPDALAFMGTGDADAYNLAAVRKETKGKWLAAAFDLDPRSLKAVKSGDLLIMSPEHFVKGAIAGRLQAEYAKSGKPLPEGWVYTPGLPVTTENVDSIITRQESLESRAAAHKPQIDKIVSDLKSYLRPMELAK